MIHTSNIKGFSGLSREEKTVRAASFTRDAEQFIRILQDHLHPDPELQNLYAGFSENAVSNYFLPLSIAPNFTINGKDYLIPMVTEESSVVAAAASAARFWHPLGGFHTRILGMDKPGHIHFTWNGDYDVLNGFIQEIVPGMLDAVRPFTLNMTGRGGGIRTILLQDQTGSLENYYQLEVVFNTAEAMGANFINTCLEVMAGFMQQQANEKAISHRLKIIMSILSNYTPDCRVECSVNCGVQDLDKLSPEHDGPGFARKFESAVNISRESVYRAVTHNKGIYNGVDAVLIATGNDFRAAEAAGHAWAAKDGTYRGLTEVEITRDSFTCKIDIPLSVGVVGGLTTLHPVARASLMLLENPSATQLMSIAAAAGLANNFSAIRALITGGLQQGHMRLHLINLLNRFGATEREKQQAIAYFMVHQVTNAGVGQFLQELRTNSADPG